MIKIISFKKNEDIKIILVLFILSCIFFWKVILNPQKVIFAEYFSDVIDFFLVCKTFIHESWQSTREIPLWNPYIFMGNPIAGNTLYSLFYPYNLLFLILQPEPLFGFLFLLNTFLIGVFTYFFVKNIGVNRFGSLVSAATFMFSGVVVMRVYAGHSVQLNIITMIPLTFLLLEIAIQKRSLFHGLLTGVPIGLQLLGGNIQVALYSLTVLGFYFVLRLLFVIKKTPKDIPKLILIMALAILVGICLSAVQMIPSFELSKLTSRSTINYEIGTAYSFPPEHLLNFVMPEFFGSFLDYTYWGDRNFWELSVYTGIFSIILAIIGFIGTRSKYKIIFLVLFIFTLLFSLGKYFPLYMIFYYFVPFFNMFRKPIIMLYLTSFSLSVLSGFGANFLTKNFNMKRRKILSLILKFLTITILLTLFTIFSIFIFKNRILAIGERLLLKKYDFFTTEVHTLPYGLDFYIDKIPEVYSYILNSLIVFLITLTSITILLYFRLKEKIKIKHFQLLLLLIILLELWYFGIKYIDVIDVDEILAERSVIDVLNKETQEFRVLDRSSTIPQYISMRYKIETITGYDPIQLENYRTFMHYFFGTNQTNENDITPYLNIEESKIYKNPKILGMLNLKYVLTNTPIEKSEFKLKSNVTEILYIKSSYDYQYKSYRRGYLPSNMSKQVYIYENKNFLPRAFIVGDAEVIENELDILKEIRKDSFDPKETIIFSNDPKVPLDNPSEFKKANITYYSPNEIKIEVNLGEPGFLVLSENYYPGWKATDNGKDVEILRTNYILRSVYLEKGEHEVKFVYDPLSFKTGLFITLTTILFLIILVTLVAFKRRK